MTVLWFDVGIKRYTTEKRKSPTIQCCGLMQESKDIQHCQIQTQGTKSCGLMQESKDIQPQDKQGDNRRCCGLMQESKDIQPIEFRNSIVRVVV